jgi:hypothetical protein
VEFFFFRKKKNQKEIDRLSSVIPAQAGTQSASRRLSSFSLVKEKEPKRNLPDGEGARPPLEAGAVIIYFSLWTTPKRKVAKEKGLVVKGGVEPPT